MAKNIFIIIILMFSFGCAYKQIQIDMRSEVVEQANEIFSSSHVEMTFCIGKTKGIYNVNKGSFMSTDQAICINSISCHTHPWWSLERFHNWIDEHAWDEYKKVYGNEVFAVMYGINDIRFYKKDK